MNKSSFVLPLAIAGLLAGSVMVSAQAPSGEGTPRNPRTIEEQVKQLKENLKLTDEQAEKVKAVFEKNQEKLKTIRDDQSLSQEDRRTKLRELFQAVEEEVKPILTPEQQAKWKEDREKRRAQRGGGQ